MKRIGILTSGGDAPGMNAAIRSVVRCGIEAGLEVFGISRGFQGLIEGDMRKLERRDVSDIMQRGGTVLRTARSHEFMEEEGFKRALSVIETFGLDGIVVVGGDGSMRGAKSLADAGVPVIALPGTIDNDLGYTDFTIGFDTAVNTVLDAIAKIRDTSSSHERTTVVEVMGRNCGDIGLFAGLAGGAERVLLPEVPVDVNEICKKIIMDSNYGKTHSVVIVCEGAAVSSHELAKEISRITNKEARLVVLSYLQRGGSPTLADRVLATMCGAKAVEMLVSTGKSYAIGSVCRGIEAIPLEEAVNLTRPFDKDIYDLIDVLSK